MNAHTEAMTAGLEAVGRALEKPESNVERERRVRTQRADGNLIALCYAVTPVGTQETAVMLLDGSESVREVMHWYANQFVGCAVSDLSIVTAEEIPHGFESDKTDPHRERCIKCGRNIRCH